jgi:hypothetical protein
MVIKNNEQNFIVEQSSVFRLPQATTPSLSHCHGRFADQILIVELLTSMNLQ